MLEYSELLTFCQKNQEAIWLVCQKVDEGGVLGVKLLRDLTIQEYLPLWEEVRSELSRNAKDREGRFIVHSIQTEAKLFIKSMLGEMDVESALSEGVSYSNDPFFSVSTDDHSLTITFDLAVEANVLVAMSDIYYPSCHVVSSKRMSEGRHTLSFPRPASGIYTIGMKINDAAYEKKITVK